MIFRLQYIIFSLAIFTSAALLFVVQPMFAKMIIPFFGGSASVWTACMLFFQLFLVFGYGYTHISSKYLSTKTQIALHLLLLGTVPFFLPFKPELGDLNYQAPVLELLKVASFSVGWPFLLLSASAPLLQRWFSVTDHPKKLNPYFLYSASNLGSMVALLSFPLLVERTLGVQSQTKAWQFGFYLLASLIVLCSLFALFKANSGDNRVRQSTEQIPWARKFTWLILAFIPSSLMLGITSYITTDVAPVSLFWIVPLALYLLSFIIVFKEKFKFSQRTFELLLLANFIIFVLRGTFGFTGPLTFITLNLALFFLLALYFHYRLVVLKPESSQLTEFYLWLAIGGVCGGIFNSIIAPSIFKAVLEYYLLIFLSLALILVMRRKEQASDATFNREFCFRFIAILLADLAMQFLMDSPISNQKFITFHLGSILVFCCLLGLSYFGFLNKVFLAFISLTLLVVNLFIRNINHHTLFMDRSFYSSIKVNTKVVENKVIHEFQHGTTTHGLQIYYPESERNEPLAYFHSEGAFGEIYRYLIEPEKQPLNIGILGLGCGTLACMRKASDVLDYFEIDSLVEKVASNTNYFTFLNQCPTNVFIGDGRFLIAAQPDKKYDIIVMDAFSSDAVPTHLLTQEAVNIYFKKLNPSGKIAINISNRFLDLTKVISNFKLPNGYVALLSRARGIETDFYKPHEVALLIQKESLPQEMLSSGHWTELKRDAHFKDWTDDFTSILELLKFGF